MKEVPTFRFISQSILIERLKVNGSLARVAIRHLEKEGQIKRIVHHSGQLIYSEYTCVPVQRRANNSVLLSSVNWWWIRLNPPRSFAPAIIVLHARLGSICILTALKHAMTCPPCVCIPCARNQLLPPITTVYAMVAPTSCRSTQQMRKQFSTSTLTAVHLG